MPLYRLGDAEPSLPPAGRFFIAPTAVLIGRVSLQDQASVWFGAVVRGDNEPIEIGERSNVQDGCVLHTDMGFPLSIGADCTVGHMAMLHGCTIGEGALVGIGATILNGAVVGPGSLVGAGSLVPEGKVIPPNCLVMGTPGRVVRELSAEHVARLKATALHYVDRQAVYAAGFGPVTGASPPPAEA
ncbi:gamma carbonic anhydrase family protein [Lutibaculum baratangense]|uniref:Carbonic anhydrase, family 3 n=1 Tax=Lutibaculum baratangense AMV1 TaxID=631454 RepID=V4QZG6_9HYPH|nr:gamma carbonic anhydrase family protein [Lutibaculum baratangense]ESR25152.1 carbonic anhydrase, family 3 [Lutibaculum baratangense AMV1]